MIYRKSVDEGDLNMLEKVDLKRKVSEEDYRVKIGALKEKLT